MERIVEITDGKGALVSVGGSEDVNHGSSTTSSQHENTRISLKQRVREKSKRMAQLLRRRRAPKDKDACDQFQSLLFRKLPGEIRTEIWKYTLAPTEWSMPTHFHIYDEVYDSCTYQDENEKERLAKRKNPTQISLLMTCRLINKESRQFLYDFTDFTLVLFAGFARPGDLLDTKHSLGKLEDCSLLFGKMRNVKIIVQPGKQPDVTKYELRIKEFLEAFQYARQVTNLTLQFNFHFLMSTSDRRGQRFVTAFLPLRDYVVPRMRDGKMQVTLQPCKTVYNLYSLVDAYKELLIMLGRPRVEWWHQTAFTCAKGSCRGRGAIGDWATGPFVPQQNNNWTASLVGMLGLASFFMLVTFPVTVPLLISKTKKRKVVKGEI